MIMTYLRVFLVSVNDPLNYKPNPNNLIPKVSVQGRVEGMRRVGGLLFFIGQC